jgi:uncharacterized protein YjbJ (UPF0337 family)
MAGTWDILQGMWKQIAGDARAEWGKLTDDQWDQIAGNRDKLVGQLQESYGWAKADAESRVDTWAQRHLAGRNERTLDR